MAEDFPLADLGAVDLIALGADMTQRYTGIEPRDAQSNLEAAVALAKMLKAKTYLFKYGVGGAFLLIKAIFRIISPMWRTPTPGTTKFLFRR